MKTGFFIFLILTLSVSQAWGQKDPAAVQKEQQVQAEAASSSREAELMDAMTRNQFQAETIARVRTMINKARQAEMPVQPLMNKVYEGIAKNVNEAKIIQALESVQGRYAYARQQARQLTRGMNRSERLGEMIQNTLAAGMHKQDMEPLMTRLQTRMTRMDQDQALAYARQSMMTARDMSRMGVSSRNVARVMNQAFQQDYTRQEMQTMSESFMHQARSERADMVARSFAESMTQGMGAGNLGASHGGMGSGMAGAHGSGHGGGSGGGPGGGWTGRQSLACARLAAVSSC